MKTGRTFHISLAALSCAGVALAFAAARGCNEPPEVGKQDTPFPPPKAESQKVDPSEIFKDKDHRVYFAPKYPELPFGERSQGLPQSGTWRGYPVLCDFNGDGRADLVASNREEDGYSAWAATPTGGWLLSNDGPAKDVGGLPRDMQYGPARAADMDGDRRPDLLLSAHSDALRIFRNVLAVNEAGSVVEDGKLHWLRTESPIENPYLMLDIAVGNLDGDAHTDVVGIGHFKGGVGVYLGDGKGGVRRLPECEQLLDNRVFGQRIELADLDGDGLDDIVATTNRGLKAWLTRKGTPMAWEERSTGLPNPNIGNSITSLCVARFRAERPAEILTGLVPDPLQPAEQFDTIGLYAWNPEKKAWEHVDSGLPRNEVYRELACGDFDSDGKLDLLAFSLENGGVFYLGDGKGGFTPKGRLPGIFGVGRVAVGDIDGDKRIDVVVSIPATKEHPNTGGIRAFINRAELWK